ncbi:protein SON-like isoform X2 [Megalops cyprinoides]|uniref:protein SON-like isoform X2 n=1 Tax=Megalops cyprinoides TaxID=118141 RepID=UPI0018642C55|nr:protein SON-like isoform X2 [Megalops cyprinoides]
MATNIEQIFRDFVMNKIRQIEDEVQHTGVTSEGHPNGRVSHSVENEGRVTNEMESQEEIRTHPHPSEAMENPTNAQLEADKVFDNTVAVKELVSKEGSETPRKKSKKHKRHKSKKKKKKKREEKESSSESGLDSDGDARNRHSAKNEATANKQGRDNDQGDDVEEGSRRLHTDPTGEEGEGRTRKQKRHTSKKKKKKRRREEEKLGKKSPTRSRSESTSASGTESEMESKQALKLVSTSSPVVTSDNVRHMENATPSIEALTVKCESTFVEHYADHVKPSTKDMSCRLPVEEMVDSTDRKDSSAVDCVAAEHNGEQVNFHNAHSPDHRGEHKEDLDIPTDENRKQDGEGGERCGNRSGSRSRSRSPSDVKKETTRHTPRKKSRSPSRSPKQLSGKSGSPKAHSTSRKRSRSASKRKNSPRKKRSRSRSRRRRSRSLSAKRRQRSKSRSCTRKRRSKSRSVQRTRRTRSRSVVRSRQSRSKSLRRKHSRSRSRTSRSHGQNRRSRSRSVRRTRQSRSLSRSRRRRSRSRSTRRTRRTRSRSIVILRSSRRNRRSTSARRNRSRTRSPKRRRSESRSPRRSRRSKSRSAVRRRRSKSKSQRRSVSKSRSAHRSKRSTSRSHTRHQSKSKSPKHGSKERKGSSPKMCKHSKSSSPTRNESNESKNSHHTSLTLEKTNEADAISEEITPQVLAGHSVKEEPPLDFASPEMGQPSAVSVEHSTDSSETSFVPTGSWKPVPFLVDSKVGNKPSPMKEVASIFSSKAQANVSEEPHDSRSPQRGETEKCFTAEMALTHQDFSVPSDSCADSQSELTCKQHYSESQGASDGRGEQTDRSRSVSPQSDRRSESLPPLSDRSVLEESNHITLMDKKTESDEKSIQLPRSSHSRSPASHDGDSLRPQSPLTEAKPHAGRDTKSTPESKLSKQRHSPASPTRKESSKSRSPSRRKKSKSRSLTCKKRSRSTSSSRRRRSLSKTTARRKKSKSKSPAKKRKSRSPSRSRKKRSKSKSPARRRRSRSKSVTRKRKSHSKSRSPKRKRSKSRSPAKRKRSKSRSPTKKKRSKSRSPGRRRRSKSADKSKRSKSRSPARRRRSRSRARRSRSRQSRSSSRRRRSGFPLNRRDRWKRTPSHSPVLILRKRRSASRARRSSSKTPPRLTELDKDQLLEIAKANAAAMCAKAGMPIPESLRPKAILQLPLPAPVPTPMSLPLSMNLPVNLPMGMSNMPNMTMSAAVATMNAALSTMSALTAMPALPTITNKPPATAVPNTANIEEVKRKVAQKANSISIKELTEKCKKIAESKEEMAVNKPHVSDDEDDEKPFAGVGLRENKGITFSLSNSSAKPATRTEAAYAKEFPVSSGSQHRKREGDGAYGEWVPVDKKGDKAAGTTASAADEEGKENDSVFPDAPLQPVDITLAVSERAVAQKRLAENPFDVNAICMLSRAQEQVDAWAQSNTIPGLFTGSTGAQVLSSEELSTSGPQAWIKKDQFLRAAPVSGGVGEFLMRKMGWRAGEGLGKYREGTVEPIVIDFKTDRKGLVAEGEKTQKSGSLVVMKDLLGKHPVSALMEMCNKKKWAPPEFVMVHDSGPDHRKNFLFKVVINGTDYQPQTASPNKKHAKAMAATVALQAMGEVSGDSVYSGPVFTAATSTG